MDFLGVGQDYSFDVIFSSGLSDGGEIIGKWVILAHVCDRSLLRLTFFLGSALTQPVQGTLQDPERWIDASRAIPALLPSSL